MPFAAPVADLAGYDKALLVELDGAARLAQICVGNAQVAQRASFSAAVFQPAGGSQRGFEPTDLFPRMLAQREQVNPGVRVVTAQCRRPIIFAGLLLSPRPSGLNVLPL